MTSHHYYFEHELIISIYYSKYDYKLYIKRKYNLYLLCLKIEQIKFLKNHQNCIDCLLEEWLDLLILTTTSISYMCLSIVNSQTQGSTVASGNWCSAVDSSTFLMVQRSTIATVAVTASMIPTITSTSLHSITENWMIKHETIIRKSRTTNMHFILELISISYILRDVIHLNFYYFLNLNIAIHT